MENRFQLYKYIAVENYILIWFFFHFVVVVEMREREREKINYMESDEDELIVISDDVCLLNGVIWNLKCNTI